MNIIRKIIREQMNLFFEAFNMQNENKTYIPPSDVAKTAQVALESIKNAQKNGVSIESIDEQGNQGSGRRKAKQLAEKNPQSFAEMKRLKSFFETNFKNVNEERKKHGITQQRRGTQQEMILSNVILVWNLHGGDACSKWVDYKLSDTHNQGNKKKERFRKAGGAYKNNGMGVFKTQYDPSQQRIHK